MALIDFGIRKFHVGSQTCEVVREAERIVLELGVFLQLLTSNHHRSRGLGDKIIRERAQKNTSHMLRR